MDHWNATGFLYDGACIKWFVVISVFGGVNIKVLYVFVPKH